jgi:RNA polymerase sigma-70 factor (ECF subfamily)
MDLLERFTRGDLDAFEAIFRQFQADVYAWILRIVRNPATAEDLTLEAFWRIYKARARFDPARPFGAWARRVATNVALDHLKRQRAAIELQEGMSVTGDKDPALQMEIAAGIQRAMNELPHKLRVVAILGLIEERPYAEIATALGISEAGVKTRVFRAVRKLRRRLTEMGIEP